MATQNQNRNWIKRTSESQRNSVENSWKKKLKINNLFLLLWCDSRISSALTILLGGSEKVNRDSIEWKVRITRAWNWSGKKRKCKRTWKSFFDLGINRCFFYCTRWSKKKNYVLRIPLSSYTVLSTIIWVSRQILLPWSWSFSFCFLG